MTARCEPERLEGRLVGFLVEKLAQAYDYLAEKGKAIKVADKEDSYNTGLRQFLDEKSYKPTFEPFKLGTMLTDQRSKPAAKR